MLIKPQAQTGRVLVKPRAQNDGLAYPYKASGTE